MRQSLSRLQHINGKAHDCINNGTHCIFGVKKSTYRSKDGSVVRDFGVFAMDTYAKDPNA